jgi:hypothetical protein
VTQTAQFELRGGRVEAPATWAAHTPQYTCPQFSAVSLGCVRQMLLAAVRWALSAAAARDSARLSASLQGLTFVHFSAQRKHFM